jgi:hypothetical protein
MDWNSLRSIPPMAQTLPAREKYPLRVVENQSYVRKRQKKNLRLETAIAPIRSAENFLEKQRPPGCGGRGMQSGELIDL